MGNQYFPVLMQVQPAFRGPVTSDVLFITNVKAYYKDFVRSLHTIKSWDITLFPKVLESDFYLLSFLASVTYLIAFSLRFYWGSSPKNIHPILMVALLERESSVKPRLISCDMKSANTFREPGILLKCI